MLNLGKLIRRDLACTVRAVLTIFGSLAVIIGIALATIAHFPDDAESCAQTMLIFLELAVFVCSLGMLATAFAMPLSRFIRAYFSREAALTVCLPIPPSAQIISKLVCCTVWYIPARLICDTAMNLLTKLINSTSAVYMQAESALLDPISWVRGLMFMLMTLLFCFMVMLIASAARRRVLFGTVVFIFGGLIVALSYFCVQLGLMKTFTQIFGEGETLTKAAQLSDCVFAGSFAAAFYIVCVILLNKVYEVRN